MKHIKSHITDYINTITLNNPAKHNSLNPSDIQQLISLLKEAETTPQVRVIIITASGDQTFCAGASFESIKNETLKGDAFSELAQVLYELKKPSICLLNGNVFGGGVELALACDFRIGLAHSKLHVPVAKLGLCYSHFGLRLYQAKLGHSIIKRILLSAETLNAPQLLQQGFYDFLFDTHSQASAQTKLLAQNITRLSPLAIQAMHQTLNDIAINQFDLANATKREQQCLNSEDKIEGFRALLERRSAHFHGK